MSTTITLDRSRLRLVRSCSSTREVGRWCVRACAQTCECPACLDMLPVDVLGGVAVEVVHDEALGVQLGYHWLGHKGHFTGEEDNLIAPEKGAQEVVNTWTLPESPALQPLGWGGTGWGEELVGILHLARGFPTSYSLCTKTSFISRRSV